jgi:hypothetical protein
MSAILKSLCWAMVMLFMAAGIRFGFMDRSAATTMLFVLPVLAVLSLRSGWPAPCGRVA